MTAMLILIGKQIFEQEVRIVKNVTPIVKVEHARIVLSRTDL